MTWRIEPSPRSAGLAEGLAARVHDPLWFLARQWQLGEFQGKDAGTPALVQVSGQSSAVNAWRGAQETGWASLDSAAQPLDALVEAEDEAAPSLRERIEAGAQFQALLAAASLGRYGPAFAAACPFPDADLADPAFAADPLMAALARRVPDGMALAPVAAALAAAQPGAVAVDPADAAGAAAVATAWLAWYSAEIAATPGAGTAATWQDHRLEYGFALASGAAGGVVLTADAYYGDGLDWYDLDIDATAQAPAGPAHLAVQCRAVPAPVRYGGMPLPRFWAMEDAASDLGAVDASAADLGRLLLVEFATVYGNDWFVLPVKLPTGSLTLLDSVVVTDVFGRNLLLARAGDGDLQWNLFSLATADGSAHPAQRGLLLPPGAGAVAESGPVESVLFLRDDMADLAWGVEARVEDNLGRGINRRAGWAGGRSVSPGDPAMPSYRVETIVPDYWIPFARELAANQSVNLRLVPMEVDDGGTPRTVEPQGRLLTQTNGDGRLWLYDEEVPREGTLVDRLYRLARWQDGRTSLWTARRRRTGTGEGSSGLVFDALNPE